MSFSIMKASTSLNAGKFLKKIWTRGDLPLTGWAEGTKLGRLWKNSRSTLTNAPVWESDSTLRNTLLGGWGRLKSWENNNNRLINLINKRMNEWLTDWLTNWMSEREDVWTKRPKMYCINYALNSGSNRKIAETLLPITIRKGSGKVWEEHDKILGGGGEGCGTFEDYQAIQPLKWLDQVTFQLTKDLMIH